MCRCFMLQLSHLSSLLLSFPFLPSSFSFQAVFFLPFISFWLEMNWSMVWDIMCVCVCVWVCEMCCNSKSIGRPTQHAHAHNSNVSYGCIIKCSSVHGSRFEKMILFPLYREQTSLFCHLDWLDKWMNGKTLLYFIIIRFVIVIERLLGSFFFER